MAAASRHANYIQRMAYEHIYPERTKTKVKRFDKTKIDQHSENYATPDMVERAKAKNVSKYNRTGVRPTPKTRVRHYTIRQGTDNATRSRNAYKKYRKDRSQIRKPND